MTMDLQTIINNAMAAKRAEDLQESGQIVLIELIMSLKSADPNLPIIFDLNKCHPGDIGSWRGSYNELAIEWEDRGTPPTVAEFLTQLYEVNGATLTGYKGGEYKMHKLTPLWVANWGDSSGPGGNMIAVTGVVQEQDYVTIETRETEY